MTIVLLIMTELAENFLNNQVSDTRTIIQKAQEKEEEQALIAKKLSRLPETPTRNSFGFIVPPMGDNTGLTSNQE